MTFLDVDSVLDTLLSGTASVYRAEEVEREMPSSTTGYLQIMNESRRRIGGSDEFPVYRYTVEAEVILKNSESGLRTLLDNIDAKFNNNNVNTNSNIKYELETDVFDNVREGPVEVTIFITDRYTEAATS